MDEQIAQLTERATQSIRDASTLTELDAVRVSVLGKKGELTALLRGMGALSAEERPRMGQLVNTAREHIETLLDERKHTLSNAARDAALGQREY
jgi:phenylalanyl-tRNA synthetase alpha chain